MNIKFDLNPTYFRSYKEGDKNKEYVFHRLYAIVTMTIYSQVFKFTVRNSLGRSNNGYSQPSKNLDLNREYSDDIFTSILNLDLAKVREVLPAIDSQEKLRELFSAVNHAIPRYRNLVKILGHSENLDDYEENECSGLLERKTA